MSERSPEEQKVDAVMEAVRAALAGAGGALDALPARPSCFEYQGAVDDLEFLRNEEVGGMGPEAQRLDGVLAAACATLALLRLRDGDEGQARRAEDKARRYLMRRPDDARAQELLGWVAPGTAAERGRQAEAAAALERMPHTQRSPEEDLGLPPAWSRWLPAFLRDRLFPQPPREQALRVAGVLDRFTSRLRGPGELEEAALEGLRAELRGPAEEIWAAHASGRFSGRDGEATAGAAHMAAATMAVLLLPTGDLGAIQLQLSRCQATLARLPADMPPQVGAFRELAEAFVAGLPAQAGADPADLGRAALAGLRAGLGGPGS